MPLEPEAITGPSTKKIPEAGLKSLKRTKKNRAMSQ